MGRVACIKDIIYVCRILVRTYEYKGPVVGSCEFSNEISGHI
jgi:hypothetical protein